MTGAEVQWEAASTMAGDVNAIKVLLSGIVPVCLAGVLMLLVAVASSSWLYSKSGMALAAVFSTFVQPVWQRLGRKGSSVDYAPLGAPVTSGVNAGATSSLDANSNIIINHSNGGPRFRIWPLATVLALVVITVLDLSRPHMPYDHISTSLPLSMAHMFFPHREQVVGCPAKANPFPFPELVESKFWEQPHDGYIGWAPDPTSEIAEGYRHRPIDWLQHHGREVPGGFDRFVAYSKPGDRFYHKHNDECALRETVYYNPVTDPLRISNMAERPYPQLQQVFDEHNATVSHIVFITMESTRKELFPMRKGSYLYEETVRSYGKAPPADLDERFSNMSRVSQQITGEHFDPADDPMQPLPQVPGAWQDYVPPHLGGINVVGATTGSTVSCKSLLGSHCGVGPLTVDFLEEVTADIYQPCLPQILKLFNSKKDRRKGHGHSHNANSPLPLHDRKWRSVFIQAVTDRYDRQDKQEEQLEFDETVSKETLEEAAEDGQSNYFGYDEDRVMPYMRNAIFGALNASQRLFLSHFTSSTHHPWTLPHNFTHVDYIAGDHGNLDKFFNVNHYDDNWFARILDLLREAGIADETLVVFVGDHGQAFEEDNKVTGTFQNPHISNFRVPIVFRHPRLPRIRVDANATSMSILPTVLDLLVQTGSLDADDTAAAMALTQEYEGQSLARPFVPTRNGRQSWNFGIINAGGAMLSVTSAAAPFRLILPLTEEFQYRFSDLKVDPEEHAVTQAWSIADLESEVRSKHGAEAAEWALAANKVGRWWSSKRPELYHYKGAGIVNEEEW